MLTDGIYDFSEGDYGRSIPYKLYKEDDTAFDASSYTGYIKLSEDGAEVITEIASNANSSGVGSFSFTSTNKIATNMRYDLEWQGEKSGRIESFHCVNPIAFHKSPTGSRTP